MIDKLKTQDILTGEAIDVERFERTEAPKYAFEFDRRTFIKVLGAGLLVTVGTSEVVAQFVGEPGQGRRGGRGQRGGRGGFGRGPQNVAARLHIGEDGIVTVMTGKVEIGQGGRAELTQCAAEELHLPVDRIKLIMGDTALVPNDGGTYGSQTTPNTVPSVRQGAAAARQMLVAFACKQWNVAVDAVQVEGGVIAHGASGRKVGYGELAKMPELAQGFSDPIAGEVALTPPERWKTLGTPVARPNLREVVTGSYAYSSDIVRPGMLYGKVLRAPSVGATLSEIDLAPAQAMEGVVAVRDGEFVGCAAPNSWLAAKAIEAIAKTAKWQPKAGQPSWQRITAWLKDHAQAAPNSPQVEAALGGAAKKLAATYETGYVAHTPMETRSAVAEWDGEKVTVWVGSQDPFRNRTDLANAFRIPAENARVIVPDTGGAFGGKSSPDAHLEAARLAKAAGKPVHVQWTREEEFTWSYLRPAGVVEMRAGLDAAGKLVGWEFFNINSGGSAVNTPYAVGAANESYLNSESPLRQGSYRALAATFNNFAREGFMDELAAAAGMDPLAFRLANLEDERIRNVLEAATKQFGWAGRGKAADGVGYGVACGSEKGSVIATCVEVAVDRMTREIKVRRIAAAFECGSVLNPHNIRQQICGALIQGLGPALRETIKFEDGKVLNASLAQYPVPRFEDVPKIDVTLLDRPDLRTVGAGETPLIALAPAIAGAVFDATGERIRSLPIRLGAGSAA
jgi:isoquinoline 1-oxidoreductase